MLWCYSTVRIVSREALCLACDPIMISASSVPPRSHVHRVMSCVCCITMRQGRKRRSRRRMEMSDRNAILPISPLQCICKKMRIQFKFSWRPLSLTWQQVSCSTTIELCFRFLVWRKGETSNSLRCKPPQKSICRAMKKERLVSLRLFVVHVRTQSRVDINVDLHAGNPTLPSCMKYVL